MANLLVDRRDGVVWLTLNRPQKKNAINGDMWNELTAVFDEVAVRADDRVLVLTGAGDGFSAGVDLTDSGMVQTAGGRLDYVRKVGRCAQALHEIPKPTIAAVNGVAVGAGCNLALGCDLVVASEAARFSEIFVRRGLSIDFGGSWVLPRLIGMHRAKELALLAEMIDAREAERLGMVNRVVAPAELEATASALAARLLAMAPLAVSQTKRLLDQAFSVSFAEALDAEGAAQVVNLGSSDAGEAIRAFVEHRDPRFTGE